MENLTNIAKGGEGQDVKAAARAKAMILNLQNQMINMDCFSFYNARKLVSELEAAFSVAQSQIYKSQ